MFFDEADASGLKARSDALCRRCESIRRPVKLCDREGTRGVLRPRLPSLLQTLLVAET